MQDKQIAATEFAPAGSTTHLGGEAASGFSAVCWFAARELFDSLGGSVPVGAIDQSYGGTSIQFWMSAEALEQSDAPVATQCCGQNGGPSCLWNTQIYPYTIGPTQLRGVLWYQVRAVSSVPCLQSALQSDS